MAMIETRTTAEGNTSFRVKVRVRGFPTQTATFARKTDAKEWGKQTEIAIKEGKYFKTAEAKKHTFKELVDRYLAYVELRNPRRHPWVKQYLEWWTEHLGDYALSEISKTLVIEKRDKLLTEKKRTNATVNRYMTALSHAFTISINEWEWVQDHPMKKIAKLPEPRGRIRFLDDDERQRLLEACQDNESIYLLVVLALSTGARHGELINLRWKDIDHLRQTNAHIKFLSLEPLLGPLEGLDLHNIDWAIVGGESGPKARPMKDEWVTSIRDQCLDAEVAFFFKQWGGVNKKKTGRILEGRTWDQMPQRITDQPSLAFA